MKSFEFFIKILSEIGKSRKQKQKKNRNIQIRSLINRDKKTSGSLNGPLHLQRIYLFVAVKNNFIEQPLFLSTKKKKIRKKSATVLKMAKNRLI